MQATERNEIIDIIDDLSSKCYNLVDRIDPIEKLGLINDLIESKVNFPTQEFRGSLYSDIKLFYKYYLIASNYKPFEYDEINPEIINRHITYLNIEERIGFLNYLISLFKMHEKNELLSVCKELLNISELDYLKKDLKFESIPKYLLLISSKDLKSICCFILGTFLVSYFVFFPVSSPIFHLFEVRYWSYTNNPIINHAFNTLAYFFDIEEGLKVKPLNIPALILLIIGKIFMTVAIINFLVKELLDRIKI